MTTATPAQVANGGPEDLAHVLEAARGALDEEFRRTELYDQKARGQMTLAGAWFAIVQAIAAVALREETHWLWLLALGVAVVAAASLLCRALYVSSGAWKPRERPGIGPQTLQSMYESFRDEPAEFGEKLVTQYEHMLGKAQIENKKRATALGKSLFWWYLALGAGLVELIVTLCSQVLPKAVGG